MRRDSVHGRQKGRKTRSRRHWARFQRHPHSAARSRMRRTFRIMRDLPSA